MPLLVASSRLASNRRGFTLVELLVAVAIFGVVGALTIATTIVQERAASSTLARTRATRTAAEALDIVGAELAGTSAVDLVSVTDSSLEAYTPVAEGVVCAWPSARVVALPPPGGAGEGARTRWRTMPREGDIALFLDADTSDAMAWRDATVTSTSLSHDPTLCPPSEGYTAGMDGEPRLLLELDAMPAGVGEGTIVRVQRRERLVLYRPSGGGGQLGVRPCPPDRSQPCGAVQPVAGPLLPPSGDPAASGLRFTLLDSALAPLAPSELARAAFLRLVARASRQPSRAGRVEMDASLSLRPAGAR